MSVGAGQKVSCAACDQDDKVACTASKRLVGAGQADGGVRAGAQVGQEAGAKSGPFQRPDVAVLDLGEVRHEIGVDAVQVCPDDLLDEDVRDGVVEVDGGDQRDRADTVVRGDR